MLLQLFFLCEFGVVLVLVLVEHCSPLFLLNRPPPLSPPDDLYCFKSWSTEKLMVKTAVLKTTHTIPIIPIIALIKKS
jgi:hypothetical protein